MIPLSSHNQSLPRHSGNIEFPRCSNVKVVKQNDLQPFSKGVQQIGEVTGERDAEDSNKALANVIHNTATDDDWANC